MNSSLYAEPRTGTHERVEYFTLRKEGLSLPKITITTSSCAQDLADAIIENAELDEVIDKTIASIANASRVGYSLCGVLTIASESSPAERRVCRQLLLQGYQHYKQAYEEGYEKELPFALQSCDAGSILVFTKSAVLTNEEIAGQFSQIIDYTALLQCEQMDLKWHDGKMLERPDKRSMRFYKSKAIKDF